MGEESVGKDLVFLKSTVMGCISRRRALENVPSMLSEEVDFSEQKLEMEAKRHSFNTYSSRDQDRPSLTGQCTLHSSTDDSWTS